VVGEGKIVKIKTHLTPEVRDGLITFLWQNMKVFAWTHEDMPRISPDDALHQLNMDPSMKQVNTKENKVLSRAKCHYSKRGREVAKSMIHPGSILPRMAGQRCIGKKV
jgi:hypothetical protein